MQKYQVLVVIKNCGTTLALLILIPLSLEKEVMRLQKAGGGDERIEVILSLT